MKEGIASTLVTLLFGESTFPRIDCSEHFVIALFLSVCPKNGKEDGRVPLEQGRKIAFLAETLFKLLLMFLVICQERSLFA